MLFLKEEGCATQQQHLQGSPVRRGQLEPVEPDHDRSQLHYMLAKFETNSGGITCWSKFELIQVLK